MKESNFETKYLAVLEARLLYIPKFYFSLFFSSFIFMLDNKWFIMSKRINEWFDKKVKGQDDFFGICLHGP